MKKYFSILLASACFLILQCSEEDPVIPGKVQKYPDSLGTEWEYSTVMIMQIYDTSAQIIQTDTLIFENTIVKIVKKNDTVGVYQNLILFESYEESTPENKGKHWYSNSETDMSGIAYSNAGASRSLTPKISNGRYLTFEEFKLLINSPEQRMISASPEFISDSIYYYGIPRKALEYPLAVNHRWVELQSPWHRERYVARTTSLQFNGQLINCYEIKVDWPDFQIDFNDYINLQIGLLRREIIADSVLFSDPINPDSGSFGKISEYSVLLRKSN